MQTANVIFLLLIPFCYSNEETPLVQTPLGKIKGYIKTSFKGRNFAAFEGIPFAKPPVGDKRFEAPEPIEPWHGIWNATYLTECAQSGIIQSTQIAGIEDCLYLNVYVPNPKSTNLDVIVHVHGGAYMYGSGHAYSRPEILMDQDIVFVTFNYRLGILGFLSTEDDVVPGNNGMKDQVLALKWVQKNIASFGGNPNSVTLTGLSAGGSSVHLHYLSELSKGLFHRGLSQSGVALNVFSLQKGAATKTKLLADTVGCPTSDSRNLVECLKQRPYQHLLSKVGLFFGYGSLPIAPFSPVVEKGAKPFLKAHPYELLRKGEVLDVPWIASNTAHEGHLPVLFSYDDELDSKWTKFAPFILDFNYTLDKSSWDSVSNRIKEYYFGDRKIDSENIKTLIQVFGDRIFVVDAETSVKLQAKAIKSPVYYYRFSYPGDENVGHGGDGKYFFGPMMTPEPLTEDEIKMSDLMVNMLLSFARTGTPTIGETEWKPTEGTQLTYLDVKGHTAEELKVKTVDELTPRAFWQSLKLAENENLALVKDEL